jgi:hypothetical protein
MQDTTMHVEQNSDQTDTAYSDRPLRLALTAGAGLFAIAAPVAVWTLDMVSVPTRLWLAFLAVSLVVALGLLTAGAIASVNNALGQRDGATSASQRDERDETADAMPQAA